LAVATITGERFPEYDQWYEQEVAENWGSFHDYVPALAKNLRSNFSDVLDPGDTSDI
jgi:hypothetical protein